MDCVMNMIKNGDNDYYESIIQILNIISKPFISVKANQERLCENSIISIFQFLCSTLLSDSDGIIIATIDALLIKLNIENIYHDYYQQIINKCDGVNYITEAMDKHIIQLSISFFYFKSRFFNNI